MFSPDGFRESDISIVFESPQSLDLAFSVRTRKKLRALSEADMVEQAGGIGRRGA